LKDASSDSVYLQNLYAIAPYANYFNDYKSTGKRAKLGTWSIHEPEKGGPGVINFYLRIYPGEKSMKNDTVEMRRTYFEHIMKALDGKYNMTFDPVEFQDYLNRNKGAIKDSTPDKADEPDKADLLDCLPEQIVNVLLYETDYAVLLP
jgi:hypothetical protein